MNLSRRGLASASWRSLGEKAEERDLSVAVFLPQNTFEVGEVVLVPRSRGGFTYGKIMSQQTKTTCSLDPHVQHPFVEWRVVYPNKGRSTENFFKDISAAFIGKLPPVSDDFSPFTPSKRSPSPPDESPACPVPPTRIVGERPNGKDILHAVFSSTNTFSPGEIVLVPRTSGGFSYGRIAKTYTCSCNASSTEEPGNLLLKHPVPGYRVWTSEDEKMRKDVFIGNIGKIVFNNNTVPNNSAALAVSGTGIPPSADMGASVVNIRTSPPSPVKVSKGCELEDEGEIILFEGEHPNDPTARSSLVRSAPIHGEPKGRAGGMLNLPPGVNLSSSRGGAKHGARSTQSGNRKPNQENNDYQRGLVTEDTPARHNHQHDGRRKPRGGRNRNFRDNRERANRRQQPKRLVVIDGPNVARKHGKKSNFSVMGIKIAHQYFADRGYETISFVPEHYVTRKVTTTADGKAKLSDFLPLADNVPLLNTLVDEGKVVLTPPQDYDDSYMIKYAKLHDAVMVTNDRLWDYIEKQPPQFRKKETRWIRTHCLSYTFVKDSLMPNPDFVFPEEEKLESDGTEGQGEEGDYNYEEDYENHDEDQEQDGTFKSNKMNQG